MAELQHEFSWSASRRATFEECARAYYHNYYDSWTGWQADALPERRRAWLLKKMTRLPMLAGDCLHQAIASWFAERRAGRRLDAEALGERAVAALRAGYKQSRDGSWRARPAKLTHLAEHHYAEDCIDEPSGRAKTYGARFVERLQQSARNFLALPELEPVRASDPADWLACEELGTIELFQARIHAVPDFALRAGGEVWILDWKTGSERPEHAFQLALYALYAEQRFGADPSAVRSSAVYLDEGRVVEHRASSDELERVLGEVHASITAMRELHFDAGRARGDAERFPMLPLGARACASCNFRELCGRA